MALEQNIPNLQVESDDMQITKIDGTPVAPRRYTRRQAGVLLLSGGFIGAAMVVLGPRIASRILQNNEQSEPHEDRYPLSPSEIQIGSMTTRLTADPDIALGLALRTAPDSNAPLVDHTHIDSIGLYNIALGRFVGEYWPQISESQSAPAITITIANLALRDVGKGKWGVLQTLSSPIVSEDPKTNGKRTIQNVYFDLSGPSLSADFVIQKVIGTNLDTMTYQLQESDGKIGEIPMTAVDEVSNVIQS